MNAPLPKQTSAMFAVEHFRDQARMAFTLGEILNVWAQMFAAGPNGRLGRQFDPDLNLIATLAVAGTMRFVTARINNEIVALQVWILTDNPLCKGVKAAQMTGIFKAAPDVCDTVQFVQFGVDAMRAAGANDVHLCINGAVRGLVEQLIRVGMNVAETIVEA